MKCSNCGAEISANSKVCEFCGSQISYEMRKEQEQLNKQGCPKCGSSNIVFNREKQGELKGKKGTAIVRSTVGVCKDCGHTWSVSSGAEIPKKRKTWLWILGWICIFPLPLTILLLRKKEIKPALKYGIIVIAWIVYLLIGLGSESEDTSINTTKLEDNSNIKVEDTSQPETASVDIKIEPNVNSDDGTVLFRITSNLPENTKLTVTLTNDNGFKSEQTVTILATGKGYTSEFNDNGVGLNGKYKITVSDKDGYILHTQDFNFRDSAKVSNSEFNIQERPAMNGLKTKRIGTYSVCYILSSDCTEETLARWYAEVKDKGYDWNIIRYIEDENMGVYGNNGIIEKDVHISEDGGMDEVSEGETVYTVGSDGTLTKVE